MTRKPDPSDINNDEWEVALAPVLEDMVRIETILADRSYRGSLAEVLSQAHSCVLTHSCVLKVTEKLGAGFVVAPWRWVVERTFSWLDKSRRLSRDYEVLPENHEAVVYITMIRLMLRRLGNT